MQEFGHKNQHSPLFMSVCLQAEVMDLVQLMGGRVYLDLNVSVTHLIAGEVGSKKYLVAASLSKPILLPSWVKACWDKSQDRYVMSLHITYCSNVYCGKMHTDFCDVFEINSFCSLYAYI